MALTANPQSALPPPSWDETIVPTLRKRLQDESRALAKRMSSSSIGTGDDSHYDIYDAYADPEYPRPTAIPRPSVSTGRPSVSDSIGPQSVKSGRSRTLSQPKLHDRTPTTAKPNTSPPLPRTASPHAGGVIPTRIPVARARAGSVSSYVTASPGMPRSESRSGNGVSGNANGYAYHPASSSPDLQKVFERNERTQPAPILMRERSVEQQDPPRASTDSEERPYEHWYRGEVSRNGGVGEYRVGKRQEMLDIANYGHKAVSPRLQADLAGLQNGSMDHRRRGSTGVPARESFYLDPGATGSSERVLDEVLPSGLDSDDNRSVEGAEPTESYTPPRRSTSTRRHSRSDVLPLQVPRQMSEPPRTPTPTRSRAPLSHETPKASALNSSLSAPGSSSRSQVTTPQSQARKRGKSPAAATPPSTKKKPRAPPVAQQRRRDDDVRRSVAEYPVPGEDVDMSNAIPTWTQPVPTTGNWDDVVLPVVARKRGLDGHYVQADGSPQPKPTTEQIPEPAPGTFGFDYSKYKPLSTQPESIPMDEFGQQQRPASMYPVDDDAVPPAPSPQRADVPLSPVGSRNARTRVRMEPPPSPAPFSEYSPSAGVHVDRPDDGLTTAQISMGEHAQQYQQQQIVDEDSGSAGCCKCIVM